MWGDFLQYTVLVAEDDNDIIKLLKLYLESSSFKVVTANDGLTALEIIQNEHIDIAILDIMMPKMDGYELTKEIRATKNIPIIILSAKSQDEDKILGLNIGADDYMTKPFNPLEIVARVNANLRRFYHLGASVSDNSGNSSIKIGDIALDTESLKLYKKEDEVVITPTEYKILALLMKSPNRVYTKSQICEAVNGEFYENYENSVAVHVSHLRDKIEDDPKNPKYIKNIRGLGYKFEKK